MFSSERVLLSKVEQEDTEIYHRWRNDMEVMASTNPSLDVYSLEETRNFVENVLINSSSSKSYIIVERKGQEAIGITSLINIDYKNRNAECIIDIGEKDYWGQGYGREAFQILLNYAFLELNFHRVWLRVFESNEKAVHLYEKLGFVVEGISRQALYRDGKWQDIIQVGMLKEEFERLVK